MRARVVGITGLVVLLAFGLLLFLAAFTVSPAQQVLVLRFGQVVREIRDPGLYFKAPLIDNVVYIEKRILDLDSPPLEVIASDQKRLVVDAFGRYRITDPLLFYQALGSIDQAESRLSVTLNSAIRRVLGAQPFSAIVRDSRSDLMSRITTQVNDAINPPPDTNRPRLGVEMVDVKIRRADLPDANSQAIYARMQTQRQQEATEIRATGQQEAQTRTADADRAATVIIANANQKSEELRGEGDATVTRIFADAYARDPEFFAFYRALQAYSVGLQGNDTRMVITPDTEFFRYFADPLGAGLDLAVPGGDLLQPSAETPPPGDSGAPEAALAPPAEPATPPAAPPAVPSAAVPAPAVPAPDGPGGGPAEPAPPAPVAPAPANP